MQGLPLYASPSLLMLSPQQGQLSVQQVIRVRIRAHAYLNGYESEIIEDQKRQRFLAVPPSRCGVGTSGTRGWTSRYGSLARQNGDAQSA